MEYYKKGTIIDLYFLQTKNYKQIELSLLRQINTKYNVKDNQGRWDTVLDWNGNGRIDPVDIGIFIAIQNQNDNQEETDTDIESLTLP